MTIDDPKLIQKMLKNKGQYPGDPQAFSIWSYINDYGMLTYAVFMAEFHVDILTSPFVHSPILLWDQKIGLTPDGLAFMRAYGKTRRTETTT